MVNQKKCSIEDLMLNLLHVVNIGLMCTSLSNQLISRALSISPTFGKGLPSLMIAMAAMRQSPSREPYIEILKEPNLEGECSDPLKAM